MKLVYSAYFSKVTPAVILSTIFCRRRMIFMNVPDKDMRKLHLNEEYTV